MIVSPLVIALAATQGEAKEIALPACGIDVPITRALLAALPDDRLTGAGDATGAVLVGDLAGATHGSVVFVRVARTWQAYVAAPGASSVGVFRARRDGAVFVWTMPDVDGPGQWFDGLSTSASGGGRFCTRLPFPVTPDTPQGQPTILSLAGFNIDENGEATLIGTAYVEREIAPVDTRKKRKAKPRRERVTLAYRYTSRDGGRRWSLPQSAGVTTLAGRYDRLRGAPPSLIASLRAQVRQ